MEWLGEWGMAENANLEVAPVVEGDSTVRLGNTEVSAVQSLVRQAQLPECPHCLLFGHCMHCSSKEQRRDPRYRELGNS